MNSWKDLKGKWKKDAKEEENRKLEDFLFSSEMCDCCGRNSLNIKRAAFVSKTGVTYVIRYCENCNPVTRWIQLKLY